MNIWHNIKRWFAVRKIRRTIYQLNFQSESDCLWQLFETDFTGQLNCTTVKKITGKPAPCEQISFYGFMAHATAAQPQTVRYEALGEVLCEVTDGPKVFKTAGFSHYNLSYYVIGKVAGGYLGIFTGATET